MNANIARIPKNLICFMFVSVSLLHSVVIRFRYNGFSITTLLLFTLLAFAVFEHAIITIVIRAVTIGIKITAFIIIN